MATQSSSKISLVYGASRPLRSSLFPFKSFWVVVTFVTVSFRPVVHNVNCRRGGHEFHSGNQGKRYSAFGSRAGQVLEDTGLDYLCGGGKSHHQAYLQ